MGFHLSHRMLLLPPLQPPALWGWLQSNAGGYIALGIVPLWLQGMGAPPPPPWMIAMTSWALGLHAFSLVLLSCHPQGIQCHFLVNYGNSDIGAFCGAAYASGTGLPPCCIGLMPTY